jgi:choice-of-anchor A domain-containing protein
LLTALGDASAEARTYAGYLAGLAPTKTLGDIRLQKYQPLTIKLGPGLNVVSIGNLITDGANVINVSAPSGAVVVFNIDGTIQLGTQTLVIAEANGINPENLIWNVQGANPIFGERAAFDGTLLNFPAADTSPSVRGR